MSDIEARFWELCDLATHPNEESFRKLNGEEISGEDVHLEAQASEQAMIEIIKLVEENVKHRSTFVHCFSELVLWKRPAPFMLVAFCMRRLRFPEIPKLIHQEADAHKGTAYYADHMNHWSAINHAYLDKIWESALSFDFYKQEVRPDELQRLT